MQPVMIDPFSAAAHTETRVLVTCPRFEPGFRGGGPVRSVSQIIDTAPSELDLVLVTRDRDLGGKEPYPELFGQWLARGRAPPAENYHLARSRSSHEKSDSFSPHGVRCSDT